MTPIVQYVPNYVSPDVPPLPAPPNAIYVIGSIENYATGSASDPNVYRRMLRIEGRQSGKWLPCGVRLRYNELPFRNQVNATSGQNQQQDVFNLICGGELTGYFQPPVSGFSDRAPLVGIRPGDIFGNRTALRAATMHPAWPPLEHCLNPALAAVWLQGSTDFQNRVYPFDGLGPAYDPYLLDNGTPVSPGQPGIEVVGVYILTMSS